MSTPNTELLTVDELVEWFNNTHPVGTDVTFWSGYPGSKTRQGQTRTEAWVLPNGDPVVSMTGRSGAVHLSHIVCAEHASHAVAAGSGEDTRP